MSVHIGRADLAVARIEEKGPQAAAAELIGCSVSIITFSSVFSNPQEAKASSRSIMSLMVELVKLSDPPRMKIVSYFSWLVGAAFKRRASLFPAKRAPAPPTCPLLVGNEAYRQSPSNLRPILIRAAKLDIGLVFLVSVACILFPVFKYTDVPRDSEIVVALTAARIRDLRSFCEQSVLFGIGPGIRNNPLGQRPAVDHVHELSRLERLGSNS
jgi:hypothetical protein